MQAEVVVVGGGPAGLAAALAASERASVLLLERERELGGILPQCIHHGFGNFIFDRMMTGPEYAQHFIDRVEQSDIDVRTETAVVSLSNNRTLTAISPRDGMLHIDARAIILAMGCRERTRNQILLPGTRPAGVYTAGTAQRLINMEGVMPGKEVVILGSGDVGLIMARRFTLEGARVRGVYEIMPSPGGLTRNLVQCLEDYGIPLHLSHTVTGIHGRRRLQAVTVSAVDENLIPVPGTETTIPCDTLILAVGLIPENELSRQAHITLDTRTGGAVVDEHMETSVPGIFACGNVVHVHDVVDEVTVAGRTAGRHAAQFVRCPPPARPRAIEVRAGHNVRYVVPQILRHLDEDHVTLYFRVQEAAHNVLCTVVDGKTGDLLYQEKQPVVRPPEMVSLTVPTSELKNGKKDIHIHVRKEEHA